MTSKTTCKVCRNIILLGADLYCVQRGVLGHRGFVPLDDTTLVCSETCVRDHHQDLPEGPRRPP